jgi:hypothetical protein
VLCCAQVLEALLGDGFAGVSWGLKSKADNIQVRARIHLALTWWRLAAASPLRGVNCNLLQQGCCGSQLQAPIRFTACKNLSG